MLRPPAGAPARGGRASTRCRRRGRCGPCSRSVETVDGRRESVSRYCVALAAATREHRQVQVGASPRGSLALLLAARALRGASPGATTSSRRTSRRSAVAALAHRLTLRPETWMQRVSTDEVARSVLDSVPVPASRLPGAAG